MARAGRTSRRITWMRKTRSARTRSSAARSRDCFSFLLFFRLRSRAASDWALRQTKFIALTNRQRSHLDRSASVAHAAEAVLRHHRSRGEIRRPVHPPALPQLSLTQDGQIPLQKTYNLQNLVPYSWPTDLWLFTESAHCSKSNRSTSSIRSQSLTLTVTPQRLRASPNREGGQPFR